MAKKPYIIALEEHYQDPEVKQLEGSLSTGRRSRTRGTAIAISAVHLQRPAPVGGQAAARRHRCGGRRGRGNRPHRRADPRALARSAHCTATRWSSPWAEGPTIRDLPATFKATATGSTTSAAPGCSRRRRQDRACQYRHDQGLAQSLPRRNCVSGQAKQDGSELNRRTSPKWIRIHPWLTRLGFRLQRPFPADDLGPINPFLVGVVAAIDLLVHQRFAGV
jgi:hypothetical protein